MATSRRNSTGRAAPQHTVYPFPRLACRPRARQRLLPAASALLHNSSSPPQQASRSADHCRPRKQHIWNVGVDFGTYASGFGYSKAEKLGSATNTSNDSKIDREAGSQHQDCKLPQMDAPETLAPVKLHHNWPDQPLQDFKTRTVCLYKGSKLESWGWSAWKRWTQMTEQERRKGDFYFVQDFKLLLHGGAAEAGVGGHGRGGDSYTLVSSPYSPSRSFFSGMVLPPGLTEVQVVADFLSELRGYIYKHLARVEPGTLLDPTAIAWCLTVPAMWNDEAKAKMRQAANRAGIASASDPGALTMVLEPEAAAAAAVMRQQQKQTRSCRGTAGFAAAATAMPRIAGFPGHSGFSGGDSGGDTSGAATDALKAAEIREVLTAVLAGGGSGGGRDGGGGTGTVEEVPAVATLHDGDVLLVLDCGGGTADITMHRVVGFGAGVRLMEAAAGKGVLAGGRYVDEALWAHLRAMVGARDWDAWRGNHPVEWMHTEAEWEAAKRQPRGPISLHLRPGLMSRALTQPRPEAAAGGMLANALATVITGGGSGSAAMCASPPVLPPDGCVVVDEQLLESQIYGPVVEQIIAAARDVMEQGKLSDSACTKVALRPSGCAGQRSEMLLAGGMANSPYVQQRVRQLAQEYGVPLLMPRQPQALVVSGAVLFGQYPSLVSARRSRLTYGISCRSLWTSDDAASYASFGYPIKLWKEEDREYVADGVFERYVQRNQLVRLDEVVTRTFCPSSKTNIGVCIDLFVSEEEDARYIQERSMRKVATVTMELPPGWTSTVQRRQDYHIEVELRFGGTEITLFARDPRTKNAVATSVQWTPEPGVAGSGGGSRKGNRVVGEL